MWHVIGIGTRSGECGTERLRLKVTMEGMNGRHVKVEVGMGGEEDSFGKEWVCGLWRIMGRHFLSGEVFIFKKKLFSRNLSRIFV